MFFQLVLRWANVSPRGCVKKPNAGFAQHLREIFARRVDGYACWPDRIPLPGQWRHSHCPEQKRGRSSASPCGWPLPLGRTSLSLHTARGRCSPFHLRPLSPSPSFSLSIGYYLLTAGHIVRQTERERERDTVETDLSVAVGRGAWTTRLRRRRLFKLDYIKGDGAKEVLIRV